MNKITLLKQNDIFPPNKLNVDQFKCTVTDFAILLEGYVSTTDFINEQYVNKNRTTWYRTQNSKFSIKPSVIRANGEFNEKYAYLRDGGIKPNNSLNNLLQQKKLTNLPSVASNSNKSSARIDGSSSQSASNIPQSNNTVNPVHLLNIL